jgi:hypothetical protein
MGEAAPAREQLRLPLDEEEPLDDVAPSAILGAPGLAHAAAERRWLSAIAEAGRRASQAETKTRFLRRLLGRVREPAIVFTEFRDTLLRLAAALASTGRPVLLLHGGVAPGERSRIQQAFNQADALLLATDAAAEGLNLHARCRIVVHYELPWSAIRLEQRAGRVDRFGQTRRVHEIALVAASTAERMVLAPLLRRVGLARSVRPGAAGLAATLTESRVAETIIGQVPFPSAAPAPPSVGTRSIPAAADAAEEVARLTDIRTLPVSAARRRQVPLASLACTRPFVPGLIVVFLISLTTASGRLVHVEPATLFLPLAGRNARRGRPRLLRALVATLARPGSAMIGPSIGRALQSAVDRASLVHRRVEEALERRHAARDRLRASAARHLVQSGLFERAPRNALSPGTGTLDASSAATPDAGHRILGVDVRLAAALHVRRR